MEQFTPERRSSHDGLTKSERQTLTDATTYAVLEETPCRWLVSSTIAFADFEVGLAYGRFARVVSNTGGEYLWTVGEPCPCPASAQHGACKHSAALLAVLIHRAAAGEAA